MSAVLVREFAKITTANNNSFPFSIDEVPLPVGTFLLLNFVRTASGSSSAATSVTDSDGNTYARNQTFAQRSNTVDASQSYSVLTDALEANDTITIGLGTVNNRKMVSVLAFSGLTGEVNARTANALTNVATDSVGFNGTTVNVAMSLANVTPGSVVAVEVGFSGNGATITPSAAQGWNVGPKIGSAVGSSDRNVASFWKVAPAGGTVAFNATLSAGSWAGNMMAMTVAPEGPAPALKFREFTANGYVDLIAKEWTGTSWQVLTPKEL